MADEKPAEGGKKRKKIKDMTLPEVEAALAVCQEKQGGLLSRYARQLQLRKKALSH